jgi:hypothetical protein
MKSHKDYLAEMKICTNASCKDETCEGCDDKNKDKDVVEEGPPPNPPDESKDIDDDIKARKLFGNLEKSKADRATAQNSVEKYTPKPPQSRKPPVSPHDYKDPFAVDPKDELPGRDAPKAQLDPKSGEYGFDKKKRESRELRLVRAYVQEVLREVFKR